MTQTDTSTSWAESIFWLNLSFCFSGNQFLEIPHVDLDPVCYLPKEVGPCRGRYPRYFYNKCTKQCEFFYYGGCYGNENNFMSLKECNSKCYCKYLKALMLHLSCCFGVRVVFIVTNLSAFKRKRWHCKEKVDVNQGKFTVTVVILP